VRTEYRRQMSLKTSAYRSHGKNEIDALVVGPFVDVNKGFKQLIYSLAKAMAES